MYFRVHFIFIQVLTCVLGAAIPCELKWVSYNLGDDVPKDAVQSHKGAQYVARARVTGSTYHVGRFVPGEEGYFHSGSQKLRYASFDLLINPAQCLLSWLPPVRYNFPAITGVPDDKNEIRKYVVSATEGLYVGRAMDPSGSGEWHPGCAYEISNVIFMYVGSSTSYQLLVSQIVGLELEIKDFTWANDPFANAGMDMLGLDSIYNKSPAESTLTITHTKTVTESTSFTNSKTTTHTAGATVSASFFGVTAEAHYEFSTASEESSTMSTEKTTEISVSRTVVVPPLTSIQACSVLKTLDNFKVDYTAHGRFTKAGFNGTQIRDILRSSHYYEDIISEDEVSVVITIEGSFRGSLAMSNQLILLPANANTGCDELVQAIEKRKRALRTNHRLLEATQELDMVMNAITGMQISMSNPKFMPRNSTCVGTMKNSA